MLLNNGADANARDGLGRPALLFAIRADGSGAFSLLEPKQQLNAKDLFGINALSVAARCGREQMVAQLLAMPTIDINSKDSCGRTPL